MTVSQIDLLKHDIEMLTMRDRIAKEDYEVLHESYMAKIYELRKELKSLGGD